MHRSRSAATELFSRIPDHLKTSRPRSPGRLPSPGRARNTCQPPSLRRLSGLARADRGFGVGQGRCSGRVLSYPPRRLAMVRSAVDRGLTGWCWWPPRAAMTVILSGTATLRSARPVRKPQRWWLWDLSDFGRQLRDLRHWLEPPEHEWLPWMRGLGMSELPTMSGLGMSELA
jgi:hypothetical protein